MIEFYVPSFAKHFPDHRHALPWTITTAASEVIEKKIATLGSDYIIRDGVAIHTSAVIEEGVIMKAPMIIGPKCFVGAHAYLRGGVFLADKVSIGPGCEIKSSFIMEGSATAHFNFVGDSILGANINMEAGAIIANHYNERDDKLITVLHQQQRIQTNCIKFGALVGDHSRIGANAVLSPGTLLPMESVVKRLELVEQVSYL